MSADVVSVGVVCDIGLGPARGGRERNEDNYLLCQDHRWTMLSPTGAPSTTDQVGSGVLLAVCDGMGGHANGHVAAAAAARVMAKLYQPGAPRRPARVLLKHLLESHRQLHWNAKEDGLVGMGTTLTALWILAGQAAWAHVGDSRLYLMRAGRLTQLTLDHTRNEFARRDGRPPVPDGDFLAQNFIYGSRGLGDNATLRLDAAVDSGVEPLHAQDRLLLCSDGLSTVVDDGRIGRCLDEHPEPEAAARALYDLALDRGSRDNVTAIVARIDELARPNDEWVDESDDHTLQY